MAGSPKFRGVRRRKKTEGPNYEPGPDYDETLPYGGKVFMARRKKADPWYIIGLEILVVVLTAAFCFYAYYYFEHFHFHVNHVYAHLGYPHAQHIIGQKYLQGHGVDVNHTMAFHWLKKASDQGHPHASYNLAIGHLEGFHKHLNEGDAHKLIKHAAANGVPEAQHTLNTACERGDCDA